MGSFCARKDANILSGPKPHCQIGLKRDKFLEDAPQSSYLGRKTGVRRSEILLKETLGLAGRPSRSSFSADSHTGFLLNILLLFQLPSLSYLSP